MANTYQTGVTYVLFGNLTNPNVSAAQKRRINAGYRIKGESQFHELSGVAFNKDTGRMEVDHAFDDTLAGKTVEVIFYKDNDIENGQVTVVTFEDFQRFPDKIVFVNVTNKTEEERFLRQVIDWFGFVNKYGTKHYINPVDIIDFYAKPRKEKSLTQKTLDFLEDVMGGDSGDHNHVILNDSNENYVKIGYFKSIRDHADLYNASFVDFQDKGVDQKYRIAIRSHSLGAGTPQAIVYMFFYGKDGKFYSEIARKIRAYSYQGVKITPHKK